MYAREENSGVTLRLLALPQVLIRPRPLLGSCVDADKSRHMQGQGAQSDTQDVCCAQHSTMQFGGGLTYPGPFGGLTRFGKEQAQGRLRAFPLSHVPSAITNTSVVCLFVWNSLLRFPPSHSTPIRQESAIQTQELPAETSRRFTVWFGRKLTLLPRKGGNATDEK